MKAIIIEDETTAVNSLKAILAQNTVTLIEVIAELRVSKRAWSFSGHRLIRISSSWISI